MPLDCSQRHTLVRRSKLFVPVNRPRFVEKAWTRGADCIILDLEDAIAPSDKDSARKMVKDVIPLVNRGGADVQVRINREFEKEDLDAVVFPGLTGVMIPKAEADEEIRRLDEMVTRLEAQRGLAAGGVQFDILIESAAGVLQAERISQASSRIVQMNIGQVDLAVDMGFTRLPELNFEQYAYAENRVLFAAKAAGIQPCGLGAQNHFDFTNTALSRADMLKACTHAFHMGYQGTILIHPAWVEAANLGFSMPPEAVALAQRVKTALTEAYARGEGSVSVDGRMYDVANMKQVDYILDRHQAIAARSRLA